MSKKLKKGFIFPATSPDGKKEWNDYRTDAVTTHTKSAYITPEGGHQFHKSHVFALKEDKFQLFSGSADTLVKIIDLERKEGAEFNTHTAAVRCLTVYDGTVYSGDEEGCLYMYPRGFKAPKASSSNDSNTNRTAVRKAATEQAGKVSKLPPTGSGHEDSIWAMTVFNTFLYTCSLDCTVRKWQLDSQGTDKQGSCRLTFQGHSAGVLCMAVVQDHFGNDWEGPTSDYKPVLFSGSMDSTIRAWNTDTAQCLAIYLGHLGPVIGLGHIKVDMPSQPMLNNVLFSCSYDGTARSWDLTPCPARYDGTIRSFDHNGFVTKEKYERDGKLRDRCDWDEEIHPYPVVHSICDELGAHDVQHVRLMGQEQLSSYEGHTDAVTAMVICRKVVFDTYVEGQTEHQEHLKDVLITASADYSISMFDISDPEGEDWVFSNALVNTQAPVEIIRYDDEDEIDDPLQAMDPTVEADSKELKGVYRSPSNCLPSTVRPQLFALNCSPSTNMELKALTEIYVPEDAHELARGDAKVVDEAINTGSNLVRVRFRGQTHRVEWAQYIFYCLPATHTANEHDIKHVLELDGTTRQVKFMGLWHEVEWMNDPPAPGVVVKAKILKCDRVMYTTVTISPTARVDGDKEALAAALQKVEDAEEALANALKEARTQAATKLRAEKGRRGSTAAELAKADLDYGQAEKKELADAEAAVKALRGSYFRFQMPLEDEGMFHLGEELLVELETTVDGVDFLRVRHRGSQEEVKWLNPLKVPAEDEEIDKLTGKYTVTDVANSQIELVVLNNEGRFVNKQHPTLLRAETKAMMAKEGFRLPRVTGHESEPISSLMGSSVAGRGYGTFRNIHDGHDACVATKLGLNVFLKFRDVLVLVDWDGDNAPTVADLVGKVGKLQVTSEVANSKVTLDIGGEKYVFLNPPLSVTGVDECVGGRVVLSNGLAFTNPSNQVENTDDQFGGDGDVLEDFCLRVGTGLPIHPNHLQGHTGPIMLLEEYRGVFYSASQDRTVRAWDIQYGVCIKVYSSQLGPVTAMELVCYPSKAKPEPTCQRRHMKEKMTLVRGDGKVNLRFQGKVLDVMWLDYPQPDIEMDVGTEVQFLEISLDSRKQEMIDGPCVLFTTDGGKSGPKFIFSNPPLQGPETSKLFTGDSTGTIFEYDISRPDIQRLITMCGCAHQQTLERTVTELSEITKLPLGVDEHDVAYLVYQSTLKYANEEGVVRPMLVHLKDHRASIKLKSIKTLANIALDFNAQASIIEHATLKALYDLATGISPSMAVEACRIFKCININGKRDFDQFCGLQVGGGYMILDEYWEMSKDLRNVAKQTDVEHPDEAYVINMGLQNRKALDVAKRMYAGDFPIERFLTWPISYHRLVKTLRFPRLSQFDEDFITKLLELIEQDGARSDEAGGARIQSLQFMHTQMGVSGRRPDGSIDEKPGGPLQVLLAKLLEMMGKSKPGVSERNRCKLLELKIPDNNMHVLKERDVYHFFRSNVSLTSVDISSNNLQDVNVKNIFIALMKDRNIKDLNIANNGITDNSSYMIKRLLSLNRSLTSVDLSNNKLSGGEDGAMQLIDQVINNTSDENYVLNYLFLNANTPRRFEEPIEEAQLLRLDAALTQNRLHMGHLRRADGPTGTPPDELVFYTHPLQNHEHMQTYRGTVKGWTALIRVIRMKQLCGRTISEAVKQAARRHVGTSAELRPELQVHLQGLADSVHPNCARVLTFNANMDDRDGHMCLYREFAPQTLLEQIVEWEEKGRYTTGIRLKRIALHMARGMSFLHKNRVHHGLLSASNVLIDDDSEERTVKISDYGLSFVYAPALLKLCSDNLGAALPPEWLNRKRHSKELPTIEKPIKGCLHPYDGAAADLWQFGCVIMHMMTQAELPDNINEAHDDDELTDMLYEHMESGGPLHSTSLVDLSDARADKGHLKGLFDVVRDCMRLDPKERRSFDDIAEEISDIGTDKLSY